MARKSKRKSKKSKAKTPKKSKEMSQIEKLKKAESDLYLSCMSNIENIASRAGLTSDEVIEFIEKNGIEKVRVMHQFEMIQPMFETFVKNWKLLEKVKLSRERIERASNRLFINEMEQHANDLEEKVKKLDEEQKFYTTEPDKDGKVHMKEKFFTELQYWEEQLSKSKTVEQYKKAQEEIKRLKSKKTWMHMKNLMPNIARISKKISTGVNTIQDSMGEIAKPFQEMGDQTGYSNKKQTKKNDDWGFNTDTVFAGTPKSGYEPRKIKKKSDDYDVFGGF